MRGSEFPAVVIGDLHGRCDLLRRALTSLGLADESGRWTGGKRRLIQLGDLIDRGAEPLATLDLMVRLQEEARQAGGEVICLLGNHEAMALRAGAGCHAGRLQWALNGGSTAYQEWRGRAGSVGLPPHGDQDLPPHPEEFYALFGPGGRYGRWLRTHRIATWLGEYVVVHAGWNEQGPASVDEANRLYADPALDPLLALTEPAHPLANAWPLTWARRQPEPELIAACDRLGCRGLITGHTIQEGIRVSAGGRLVQIDVGMFHRGLWAAVGMDEAGWLWSLLEGAEPCPLGDEGLVPMPTAAATPPQQEPPRFRPGQLVELYRSPLGDWVQFFFVRQVDEEQGVPFYAGEWITASHGAWSREERRRPAAWIDRLGRAAPLTELAVELQQVCRTEVAAR